MLCACLPRGLVSHPHVTVDVCFTEPVCFLVTKYFKFDVHHKRAFFTSLDLFEKQGTLPRFCFRIVFKQIRPNLIKNLNNFSKINLLRLYSTVYKDTRSPCYVFTLNRSVLIRDVTWATLSGFQLV